MKPYHFLSSFVHKLTTVQLLPEIYLILRPYYHNKTTECWSEISQVILWIVLPILTKFLQNIQIRRELKQEVAKQSAEYLGYFSLLHSVVLVCVLCYIEKLILYHVLGRTQCPRTDLNKMFLPKPMTTTGWKRTP